MSRPRAKRTDELAALEAQYAERRAEIERDYAEFVDGMRRLEAAIVSGKATRSATERAWRARNPGKRVMTLSEVDTRRRELLREAHEDYRRELETFELREKLFAADPEAPDPRRPKRGPGRDSVPSR